MSATAAAGGMSPSLSAPAGGVLVLFAVSVLAAVLAKTRRPIEAFLLVAIWLRFTLSAFPHVARMGVGPLSVNAITSIAVTGIGMLLLRRRTIPWKAIPPIVVLWVLILISGLMNHNLHNGVETIVKYAYFLILIFAFVEVAHESGLPNLLGKMLALFLVPLGFQAASVVLGVAKETEGEGAASYIGGYGHESGFSVVLMTGMFVAMFNRRLPNWAKVSLVGVFAFGIYLANYRTSIVAMAPSLAVATFIGIGAGVVIRQRPIAMGGAICVLLAAALVVPQVAGDRFDTLLATYEKGSALLKPASEYRVDDKKLMSGRAYFWATYYDGYRYGTTREKVFGHGQDSWQDYYKLYAHNTLFSQIYELGITGVIAMIGLWLWMLAMAWRVGGPIGTQLMGAHVTFIALNMSTMPMWQIEGIILYAVICGLTFHYLREREKAKSARANAAGRWTTELVDRRRLADARAL